MKYPFAVTLASSVMLAGFMSSVQADDSCGRVTIADMNWNSATLVAHIDKFILDHGLGCRAELVPGDSMPTTISMIEKGQPDVSPEFWTNTLKETVDRGIEEKHLQVAGQLFAEGAQEGFWVPQYMVDKYPELATIEGIRKRAELFQHPEYSDKSALYNCPSGWACQVTTQNLFNALNLQANNFELVDPGSGGALAGSIARAYAQEQPWLGYYWSPTPEMGQYPMVKVDFGVPADIDEFLNCTTQADCLNPKVTMHPPATVATLVTTSFASDSPAAVEYFSRRTFTNQQMSEMLAWMGDYQADGEMAMEHFLRKYPTVWQAWLTEPQARKVQQKLDRM